MQHSQPNSISPEMTKKLQALGAHVDRESGDNVGFSLWLFDANVEDEVQHYFVSSVDRELILAQLAAWLAMQLDYAEITRDVKAGERPDIVEDIRLAAKWLATTLADCTISLPAPTMQFEREGKKTNG